MNALESVNSVARPDNTAAITVNFDESAVPSTVTMSCGSITFPVCRTAEAAVDRVTLLGGLRESTSLLTQSLLGAISVSLALSEF